MKFGVREICNVTFKAKSEVKIGNTTFKQGQPVLYIDSAKTSTLEGAATTVYAQGGRGNTRLIAWEGEKTLTFTVEDALLSPLGLSVLTVGTKKDMNDFLNYTVYQLFDEFRRYELKEQYDVYFKARMAGAKDMKEPDDWMQDLHNPNTNHQEK